MMMMIVVVVDTQSITRVNNRWSRDSGSDGYEHMIIIVLIIIVHTYHMTHLAMEHGINLGQYLKVFIDVDIDTIVHLYECTRVGNELETFTVVVVVIIVIVVVLRILGG